MRKNSKTLQGNATEQKKYVYLFGKNMSDGDASMNELLGGKGANLAEMATLGLPVPAGFTITTECCVDYFANGEKNPECLQPQIDAALKKVEKCMGMKFGDPKNPLLVSCRSGARKSMPGMMETVLNVGLATSTIPGLIKKTKGNERFVYDAYRRLIMMYSDVVMEKAEGIEPKEGEDGIRKQLDLIMDEVKNKKGYKSDTDLTVDDLKDLCDKFKTRIKKVFKKEFPDEPFAQMQGAIAAVFKSWNGKKAVAYRKIEGIPDTWGTAVNVQSMVFGNMGDTSATGVAFTRNPANGDNKFYGEWLVNAQGEDVVAGTRTPNPLNDETKNEQNKHLVSMQESLPETYRELVEIRNTLEQHYHDMLDIEFTIQDRKLYMLQCRVGKRTGMAALNMAIDMLDEKLIDEKTAVLRLAPNQMDELLHPILDQALEKTSEIIAKGLPAGPGGAVGMIVFDCETAARYHTAQHRCILVREETNPEDVQGMRSANGILTARGGMTSHAALVCRGWGKCCIVGASGIKVDEKNKILTIGDKVFKEGDYLSLNGTLGLVYAGQLETVDATENPKLIRFLKLVDKYRKLGVRANADTPKDAELARCFGAEGIGLFRTEHMFYGGNEEALFALRKMILSSSREERITALQELYPFVKHDIQETMEAMKGLPVTIRFLDPPLHEFVPHSKEQQEELAKSIGITMRELRKRADALKESNPMMGHRGVRLGITYPEITKMQARAIFEAAADIEKKQKVVCHIEMMVPVTCDPMELKMQKKLIREAADEIAKKRKGKGFDYLVGTMIEVPRAAIMADKMAEEADFFSFGTNDLTQMTFGFSRDDIGSFLTDYKNYGVIAHDPFQTIDRDGVGFLIGHAVKLGRSTKKDLKIGICGEQGGDPSSVEFCHKMGLNYVSCSPFRIPVARLAAAHAAIKAKMKK